MPTIASLKDLTEFIGSEKALKTSAGRNKAALVVCVDDFENASMSAKKALRHAQEEVFDNECKVSRYKMRVNQINDEYEQAVYDAKSIRDTALAPVLEELGDAEGDHKGSLKLLEKTNEALTRAEQQLKSVMYVVTVEETKKVLAVESLENIREFLGFEDIVDITEAGRDTLKMSFHILVNLEFASNPFIVENNLVDEVVVQKQDESLLEMQQRMGTILGLRDENDFVNGHSVLFSSLRSPDAHEKKSGNETVVKSTATARSMSFEDSTLLKKTWSRGQELKETKVALKEKDDKIRLLKRKLAEARKENGKSEPAWDFDSDERGHKKQRTEGKE